MNLTSHTESVLASVNCRYTSATRNEVNPTESGLSVPHKIRIVYIRIIIFEQSVR